MSDGTTTAPNVNPNTIAVSDVCSAFERSTIGSKVLDRDGFLSVLCTAIENHDRSQDRTPGQHFIVLGPEHFDLVSAGDGQATEDPKDYLLRSHRGQVQPFLLRSRAGATTFLAVVVYDRDAYLADPEVSADSARSEGVTAETTHVVVAVIASSGPSAPLTPWRFLCNLAGGNRDAETMTAEEIREQASTIKAYWQEYAVVADHA